MKLKTSELPIEAEAEADFLEIDFEEKLVKGYDTEREVQVFKASFFDTGKIEVMEE